jgi:hypothetical protein
VGIRAEQTRIVELLTAGGVAATDDPAKAATRRPCVLVAPPSLDYRARLYVHRLVALSSHDHGSLPALEQLDQLVAATEALLPVETADPGAYALTPETGTVPAYVMRVTT